MTWLKEQKLSAKTFAEKAGIPRDIIISICIGRRPPNLVEQPLRDAIAPHEPEFFGWSFTGYSTIAEENKKFAKMKTIEIEGLQQSLGIRASDIERIVRTEEIRSAASRDEVPTIQRGQDVARPTGLVEVTIKRGHLAIMLDKQHPKLSDLLAQNPSMPIKIAVDMRI